MKLYQVYTWHISRKGIYLVYTWFKPGKNFLGIPDEALRRRPTRGIPERISRLGWGVLKIPPMANGRQVSFKLILSLRKLEC